MRFQQTKDGMCYYFFFFSPKVFNVPSSKNRFLVLWYLWSKHLLAQKEMRGGGWGEANWQGGGEMGRRNERRKKSRKKEREKTQRKRNDGGEEAHSRDFFFIKFQPKEAVYTGSPFSPSEARRQTKMLCQLQKKSMKILFRSPFHHSARMVSFTF